MRYDGCNFVEVMLDHNKFLYTTVNNVRSNHESAGSIADFSNMQITIDFTQYDLSHACFYGSTLINCVFSRNFMKSADFRACVFLDCKFEDVVCEFTTFSNAKLINTSINNSSICLSDFSGSILDNVDFNGTDIDFASCCLMGSKIKKIVNTPYIPLACPESGAFIGWKKCKAVIFDSSVIVKLLIPENAQRSSAFGRKCRASEAKVLAIQDMSGNDRSDIIAHSLFDFNTIYKVGETVKTRTPFCENRFEECASGIHFFTSRQEAVEY